MSATTTSYPAISLARTPAWCASSASTSPPLVPCGAPATSDPAGPDADASPHTGCVCCCLSSVSPSFAARSRWIASCGMRSRGPVRTRCSSPSAVTRRPASSSSRSSHELSSGPP
ncbi:Uncharacterised protein [Mycobacteroides abscessus]|nr:Uncharacterised protein [Mycobacteroides abscessus]